MSVHTWLPIRSHLRESSHTSALAATSQVMWRGHVTPGLMREWKTLGRIHWFGGRQRQGGGQWSLITKKCIISGALTMTAEMSASWSWIIGNFTIIWSLSRRGVVFKFAIWEGSAKWHLLGRCTLLRWQWNRQQKIFKFMQKWIDNSWTTCHVMRSQGKRQFFPFLSSRLSCFRDVFSWEASVEAFSCFFFKFPAFDKITILILEYHFRLRSDQRCQ